MIGRWYISTIRCDCLLRMLCKPGLIHSNNKIVRLRGLVMIDNWILQLGIRGSGSHENFLFVSSRSI